MRTIARETGFLLDTADAVHHARRLRDLDPVDFATVSVAFLRRGAANLRAAAYSLRVAADRLDHEATLREQARP